MRIVIYVIYVLADPGRKRIMGCNRISLLEFKGLRNVALYNATGHSFMKLIKLSRD